MTKSLKNVKNEKCTLKDLEYGEKTENHGKWVETEAAGFLALPEEVLEEVVQHVAMSVELQETLRVLRFRGGALGCAVHVQPGYHADLARLLVTDYQHVLFVFFLCHLKNVLMGYL